MRQARVKGSVPDREHCEQDGEGQLQDSLIVFLESEAEIAGQEANQSMVVAYFLIAYSEARRSCSETILSCTELN